MDLLDCMYVLKSFIALCNGMWYNIDEKQRSAAEEGWSSIYKAAGKGIAL